MSQIANALAKAKERTGQTTAPFLIPGAAPAAVDPVRAAASAAAIKKARNTRRFWIILTALMLPYVVYAVWSQLRREPEATTAAAPATPASTAPKVNLYQGPAPTLPHPAPSPSATSATEPAPIPVNTPPPRTDLMTTVASLPVSAVMPGEPPRIMVAGRVVRQGQLVEGELTFSGVADGLIIFTDSRGALYSRRY